MKKLKLINLNFPSAYASLKHEYRIQLEILKLLNLLQNTDEIHFLIANCNIIFTFVFFLITTKKDEEPF